MFGSGIGITATCLDSHDELHAKYSEARAFVESIESQAGRVLTGIDAKRLSENTSLRAGAFDRIIWNFPHTGSGITDKARNVREQQAMLSAFFVSATPLLSHDGEIHVTIKRGKPYDEWAVPKVAAASTPALSFSTGMQFFPHLYPGYTHRRTGGRLPDEENEDLEIGATTYVFPRASTKKSTPDTEDVSIE